MSVPIKMLREVFADAGINSYTELPREYPESFVLIVYLGASRSYGDMNRQFVSKEYSFTFNCYANTLEGVIVLSERVADILEDRVFWSTSVEGLTLQGGSSMPPFDGLFAHSVNASIIVQ